MALRKSVSEPGGNGTGRHPAGDRVGKPAISWSDGVILVNDRRLIDAANPGACREFMERAFRLPEVRSVELDWTDGTARVRYHPRRLDAVDVLERLAAVIRGEAVEGISRRGRALGAAAGGSPSRDVVPPWVPAFHNRSCERVAGPHSLPPSCARG